MHVIDLFCGAAGGWSKGLAFAGYRTVAACEIDPWRRAVFMREHPGCVMYADVRELGAAQIRHDLGYLPDVIVGSPPCQEISAANTKGAGITDDHLFWEWARLVFEVRPLWCAAENSPRSRTAGIDGILDALDQAGYAAWPCVVGADNAGANHRRKRLWLIAADAERIELWQQPGRGGRTNGRIPAIAGEHDPDAGRLGCGTDERDIRRRQSDLDRDDPDADGRLAGGTRRHADGCLAMGAGADGGDVGHAPQLEGLRRGRFLGRSGAEPAQADLPDASDAQGVGMPGGRARGCGTNWHGEPRPANDAADPEHIGCEGRWPECERGAPAPALPRAIADIGRAWPHWNGGLPGLAAACAAAGFGAVDDGPDHGLPAGLRNRAIAALGDAVIPQIAEAIGNAMRLDA